MAVNPDYPTNKEALMGWNTFAENDDEKVLEKQRADGGTEYLHIYKDDSLANEASTYRNNGSDHDHIAFNSDGSVKYDSTQER